MEEKEINDNYKKYYKIESVLGKGQFGKVYKAINKKTKEMRAIKVMDIDEDEDIFMKHIKNEIKNMKICSYNNDNSVKIYECFHYKNKDEFINEYVIVMELCDNSLQKILDDKKEGFTIEEIYNIMNQLNNTFRIMNKNKIIHRDIKLENIVVKMNKEKKEIKYKLTDYGMSKQLMDTIGKSYVGTALTMAPEIFEGGGEKKYDEKCDLWSIGIIIYQLFFKEYPYKGETQLAIYNNIKNFGRKILKRTKNNNLDNLIDSLLIKEPNKRINYEKYFNHPFFKENINNYKKNNNNYIISEIEIKSENQKVRIINSLEQFYNKYKYRLSEEWKKKYLKEEYYNEKEIKEKCRIKINDEIIPFSYFYEFKNIGKYRIIYLFNNNITKCNFLFAECESLISIDLSNFNTQNVIYMDGMFSDCKSLKSINLSNFNTQNVTYMNGMFSGCESLKKENIITKDNNILNKFD